MSESGKGNAEDIIEFDTLDLDEDKSGSNKITELQNFLKKTLKPDKYSARGEYAPTLHMRIPAATLINVKKGYVPLSGG